MRWIEDVGCGGVDRRTDLLSGGAWKGGARAMMARSGWREVQGGRRLQTCCRSWFAGGCRESSDLLACVGEEVDRRHGQLVGDGLRQIAGRDGELLSLPEMVWGRFGHEALLVAHGKGAVASLANAADVIVGFLCCVAMLGLQMEEEIYLGCL
ncbi:hypothetical protein ACLOJK_006533 [Asimina triloba]